MQIEKWNYIMRPAPCRGGDLVIPLRTHADFSRQMITDSASILTTYCIVIAFWAFPFLIVGIISDRYCMTLTKFEECNVTWAQKCSRIERLYSIRIKIDIPIYNSNFLYKLIWRKMKVEISSSKSCSYVHLLIWDSLEIYALIFHIVHNTLS